MCLCHDVSSKQYSRRQGYYQHAHPSCLPPSLFSSFASMQKGWHDKNLPFLLLLSHSVSRAVRGGGGQRVGGNAGISFYILELGTDLCSHVWVGCKQKGHKDPTPWSSVIKVLLQYITAFQHIIVFQDLNCA